jgi:hypothetical protein
MEVVVARGSPRSVQRVPLEFGGVMSQDLWTGADVVWRGPEFTSGDMRVSPGDRAVVADAGEHHVSSFTALARGRLRASTGVTIRIDGDGEIRVNPKHLEVVAPDHPLRPESEGAAAEWWLDELQPWGTPLAVSSFVPRRFESVCRVLHRWTDGAGRAVRWEQVAPDVGADDLADLARRFIDISHSDADAPAMAGYHEPAVGELDADSAEALVEVLIEATTTPDDVYVAVWDGWGDVPPGRFPGAAHLPTPARGHFLLRGPLEGLLTSVSAIPSSSSPASGIWWPRDRAWFVQTEVDFAWAFVAGDSELIRELHRDPALEIKSTRPAAPANEP